MPTTKPDTKTRPCKYCQQGHHPKIMSDGKVRHWIVKSIIPARINIVDCKAPDAAIAAAKLSESQS